jgi:4-amino-4-deoxy-L-arabinose transferase-like glycosyltransferase
MKKYFPWFILATLIVYVPFFLHLDVQTLRIWDEARMANNSIEMFTNGNYWIPHFEGEIDMWCTKPPLLLWLQVLGYRVLGIGELAIRLPSALSGLFLCFVIITWSKKELFSVVPAFVSILILAVSEGFSGWHGARTGDYDILLSLVCLLMLYYFYAFGQASNNKQENYWYAFLLCTAISVWVKGIASLIFLPILLLFFFVYRKGYILKKRGIIVSIISASVIGLGYYLIREMINPGYLATVYSNEIGGRVLHAIEGHDRGFWYYFVSLPKRFGVAAFAIIPSMIVLWWKGSKEERKLVIYLSSCALFYVAVLTIAKTKLPWYDLPLFAIYGFIIGIGFNALIKWLGSKLAWKHSAAMLSAVILAAVFYQPYLQTYQRVFKPVEYSWDEAYYHLSYFLQEKAKTGEQLEEYLLIDTVYCAHNLFYQKWLNAQGSSIAYENRCKYIQPGKTVIVHQSNVNQHILDRFEFNLLEEDRNVKVYEILRRKEDLEGN